MTAWSSDMIHWSSAHLLLDVPSMFSKNCTVRYAYASVLDPASPSRNFDLSGDAPYLYVTRFNLDRCQGGPNRDLVRIRLTIGGTSGSATP